MRNGISQVMGQILLWFGLGYTALAINNNGNNLRISIWVMYPLLWLLAATDTLIPSKLLHIDLTAEIARNSVR